MAVTRGDGHHGSSGKSGRGAKKVNEMTFWSLPALLLLGVALGPNGLNLLTPSVLQLLDPLVAMALALVGAFVGLNIDTQEPRVNAWIAIAALGGAAIVLSRRAPATMFLIVLAMGGIAVIVAFAGWLLVGQTDSEREQQVFVVGSLLLVGGAAAYMSLSALFAGLFAGILWNAAGDLARARIVKELDYFQHPLIVLLAARGRRVNHKVCRGRGARARHAHPAPRCA